MVEVRPLAVEDIPAIASLLGRAFGVDAMLTWTLPAGADPIEGATRFFGTFHRAALSEGWVWVAGDGRVDGMAMWVPPDPNGRYEHVMAEIDDDVRVLMGERKERYDRFWAWIDEHRPVPPHWYLEHIAVEPSQRGTGLGRALIQHGLGRADADGALAWLVTSRPENVPLYERFGFEVRDAEDAPDGGPHLWFMRREPR